MAWLVRSSEIALSLSHVIYKRESEIRVQTHEYVPLLLRLVGLLVGYFVKYIERLWPMKDSLALRCGLELPLHKNDIPTPFQYVHSHKDNTRWEGGF